jgi:hypothetical protein
MVMPTGQFKPRKGLARCAKSPMATPREMLDRLRGDVDSLVVAVLDDLTFEVIRAYRNRPPPGYLEWVSATATRRVRRLAHSIFHSRATSVQTGNVLHPACDPDAIQTLVLNWLKPQMALCFGPLPERVNEVFSTRKSGAVSMPSGLDWMKQRRRVRLSA